MLRFENNLRPIFGIRRWSARRWDNKIFLEPYIEIEIGLLFLDPDGAAGNELALAATWTIPWKRPRPFFIEIYSRDRDFGWIWDHRKMEEV